MSALRSTFADWTRTDDDDLFHAMPASGVRTFDGVDDKVTLAIGSLNFAFGPGTIALILRKADDTGSEVPFIAGVSAIGARYSLEFNATNLIARAGSSTVTAPTCTVTAASGWALVAWSKATGTVAPRFHRYNFGTATWTHEDGASSIANSAAAATSAFFGATNGGASFFAGDIGIGAVWNSVLSDAAVEDLVIAEQEWTDAAPVALWPLTQGTTATAIQDTIGAADQTAITGTAVTAIAIPWTGAAGTSDTATMGVATASGISPAAQAAATMGTATVAGVSPGAAAAASAGTATAQGVTPTATITNATTAGTAVAAGVSPTSAASQTATMGVAVTIGFPPTDNTLETTPTMGIAVGQGVSPSSSVTQSVTSGTATAAGISATSAAAGSATTGVATGTGIAPTTTTGATVTMGLATAAGITPTPLIAGVVTGGLAAGVGIPPGSLTAATATTGIAVAFGFEPTITRPAIRVRLTTGTRTPDVGLTTGTRDVSTLEAG